MIERIKLREGDSWINEKEVSRITGLAIPTLRNYRHRKIRLAYSVVGKRACRYKLQDVIEYMERNRVETENPR
jgi:hypothetical protein